MKVNNVLKITDLGLRRLKPGKWENTPRLCIILLAIKPTERCEILIVNITFRRFARNPRP